MKSKGWIIRFIYVLIILETSMTLHEYGHLKEFQKKNIPIDEFSIGIGPALYEHQAENFKVSIRAIPLVAYVAPTDYGAKLIRDVLSSWDRIIISLAGIRNNIMAALIVVFFLQMLGKSKGYISWKELAVAIFSMPIKLFIRFFYLMGECLTFGRLKTPEILLISIGKIKPRRELRFFIFLNLALGLLNLVPIFPLDGAKIAVEILPLFFVKILHGFSTPLLIMLIIGGNRARINFLELGQNRLD